MPINDIPAAERIYAAIESAIANKTLAGGKEINRDSASSGERKWSRRNRR